MSEFEDKLNSVLGDPAQMEKIANLAKTLMGGDGGAQDPLRSRSAALISTPAS